MHRKIERDLLHLCFLSCFKPSVRLLHQLIFSKLHCKPSMAIHGYMNIECQALYANQILYCPCSQPCFSSSAAFPTISSIHLDFTKVRQTSLYILGSHFPSPTSSVQPAHPRASQVTPLRPELHQLLQSPLPAAAGRPHLLPSHLSSSLLLHRAHQSLQNPLTSGHSPPSRSCSSLRPKSRPQRLP